MAEAKRENGANEGGVDEKVYKEKIANYLNYVLDETYIPELGKIKKGKVRDIYMTNENVIMFASDRVSAFDRVLDTLIPFKGYILNLLSIYGFQKTTDIVPNALTNLSAGEKQKNDEEGMERGNFQEYCKKYMVDENVVVQKKMKNLNVEFIVRGYLWGSMAKAYEDGEATFCGLSFADLENEKNKDVNRNYKKLIKYEKFSTPILTPTTKAEMGEHDMPLRADEVEKMVGKNLSEQVNNIIIKLYNRGNTLAGQSNLILIDTKYEFGVDENSVLHVIDEVNTPDSSRLCDKCEYDEKFKIIEEEMNTGTYKNVDELLSKKPQLKIKEYSKQYVRDVLTNMGVQSTNFVPKLSPQQVVECVYRYMHVYERITGNKFVFPDLSDKPKKRMLRNLVEKRIIKGCCAGILAGSPSDMPHIEKIANALTNYNVPSFIRICSAHKQPGKLERLVSELNRSDEPLVLIGVAGGTDALSGTASFLSTFPVVSCPPSPASSSSDVNFSCLFNPPGSSNAYIIKPDNVAKFVAQSFSLANEDIAEKLRLSNQTKIKQLEEADESR